MSSSTYAVWLFGYKISPAECRKIESRVGIGHSISELLDYGGSLKLPSGFFFCLYNDEDSDSDEGVIVGVESDVASKVIRGDAPYSSLNMDELHQWIKKWMIHCDDIAPAIHCLTHTS